jgi:hypothetical protein
MLSLVFVFVLWLNIIPVGETQHLFGYEIGLDGLLQLEKHNDHD